MSPSIETNPQHTIDPTSSHVSWIFFALNSKPTSLRQVLGRRTGESEPVVIVENPVSVLRSRSIPNLKQRIEALSDSATTWRYHPLHLPEGIAGIAQIVRYWNRRLLQSELDRLTPAASSRIVCYDSPSQYRLVKKLQEHISIYLAVDDRTLTVEGEPIPGELEAERQLLGKIDKVICVSESLAETLRSRIPGDRNIPVHVLPNGYDERLFDPGRIRPEPQILSGIPRPRILVTGHVSERIDWDGIERAARARPEWAWLFVGPADQGIPQKIDSLNKRLKADNSGHAGLFCCPPVPILEVPALIAHCDVCAIPYRLNPFTLASSPLKGSESLAMGAPILSTRIPSLKQYDRVIQWVEEGNGQSYANALDTLAGQKKNPAEIEKRRAAVAGDTWAELLVKFRKMVFTGKQ
jgi:glycosyltransferase involved in cell wall biosynthesis